METATLLSLNQSISLLILSAFVSVFIARKKGIIAESLVWGVSAVEKHENKRITPIRIFIPNVLARWPWPRRINPNYAVVKKEADTWITSFQAFTPKAQDAFNRCDFSKCFPPHPVRILMPFHRSPRLLSIPYGEQR